MSSLKTEFPIIEDYELEAISGGMVCSVFDVACQARDALRILAHSVSIEKRPAACIPKSAWNPAPPVPCP